MQWSEYIAFTATTALPGTDSLHYLELGVLEEAHEALAAYCNLQAALVGRQKRVLRGDSAHVLQAKTDAAEIARRQLVEELGDLAWYVGRMMSAEKHPRIPAITLSHIGSVARAIRTFAARPCADHAADLLAEFLDLARLDLDVVLAANVAKLTARKAAGTIKGEGSR